MNSATAVATGCCSWGGVWTVEFAQLCGAQQDHRRVVERLAAGLFKSPGNGL